MKPHRPRFSDHTLLPALRNEKKIPILGFEPNPKTQHDRFGNRVFRSHPAKVYSTETHVPEKMLLRAALLVSPAGERYLKSAENPLTHLDNVLVDIHNHLTAHATYNPKDVLAGMSKQEIRFIEGGGQSFVFKYAPKGKQPVIVKIPSKPYPPFRSPFQPYILEMLEAQALHADCGAKLAQLGVRMPEYLFASSSVACREYVDGTHPTQARIKAIEPRLRALVNAYIHGELKKGNALWKNVSTDIRIPYTNLFSPEGSIMRTDEFRIHNFIEQRDGTLVWIDPFRDGDLNKEQY